MNDDIIKGNWQQIKGEAKKKWGELNDDEIKQMDGQKDKFLGSLREKYGHSKDAAEKEFNGFLNRFNKKDQ